MFYREVNGMTPTEFNIWFENSGEVNKLTGQFIREFRSVYNDDELLKITKAISKITNKEVNTSDLVRANINSFSKAKTFTYSTSVMEKLGEYSKLVKSDPMSIEKHFKGFLSDIRTLNDQTTNWTKTEFSLMTDKINSAKQMSDWWIDDNVVNLTYKTKEDNRVRTDHQLLDLITLPKTHKFWYTHTPPLTWNCRCKVVVTEADPNLRGIVDVTTKGELKDITELFNEAEGTNDKSIRTSLIKSVMDGNDHPLIGKSHPYYKNYQKNEL